MPTILIITDTLPNQINGITTIYKNIETCAVRDGYNIVVLHPGLFSYIDRPEYNKVKLAYSRALGKKIEEINPDYIHIATEGPFSLRARAYLSLHSYRYNTSYHSKFPEGFKKLFDVPENLSWTFVRWFHKNSSKVLTHTSTMVKQLKEHGFTGDIISWACGVDCDAYSPALRNKQNTINKTLICVSRISKEKNLEAFFELDYPDCKKIMVGDGPMREEYEKQYPNVEFVGFKIGTELASYYANADVFVFPSHWETFGIVMIESMACGTPVAAYPCQGPMDIIDEGVTGCMNDDLKKAVDDALMLDRQKVREGSERWTWEKSWEIFRDNLTEKMVPINHL